MKILSMLILCLLVTCKVSSQVDTVIVKTKYVFLTEEQAKSNIKELIAFDALKEISIKQEERIENFKATIKKYIQVVEKKDSIINYKDNIISLQDKIIKNKKPIEFHTYTGMEIFNLELDKTSIYYRAAFEMKKINIGAKVIYRPVDMYNMPNFYYNLNVEYKIH